MAKTNQEILNQIRDNASAEYQSRIPAASNAKGAEIYSMLDSYPTMKNEFIQALTNKIVKSVFYSKVFNNPLKMLHRGELPFGYAIENVFVEMAEKRGGRQHFEGSDSVEGDLIRTASAKVKVQYLEKNFEYKYKVSISEDKLRTAFLNADGLSNMVTQLVNSEISAAYHDEYKDMMQLIATAAEYKVNQLDPSTGLMAKNSLTGLQGMATETVTGFESNPRVLVEKIRELAGTLQFPDTRYNMAGVETWSNPQDLIFLTTPGVNAKLDVNVLAQAFNVSAADVKVRTIVVKELPQTINSAEGTPADGEVIGLVLDRDFIQAYDTLFKTRTFENGDQLTTNIFLHKHGVMGSCYFANSVAILNK